MKDPIFARRGSNGKLIAMDQLMTPAETLLNRRIVHLSTQIAFNFEEPAGRGQVDIISEALLCLDAISNDPIKLIISSPGGSLLGTFSLYDTMKSIDSPVWTFGRRCESGAALILAAGEKGHRYVYPNTFCMLHIPQVYPSAVMRDRKLEGIRAEEHERQETRLINLLIDCGVNKCLDAIREDIDREYWMDAEETVGYGLADEVIKGGLFLKGGEE